MRRDGKKIRVEPSDDVEGQLSTNFDDKTRHFHLPPRERSAQVPSGTPEQSASGANAGSQAEMASYPPFSCPKNGIHDSCCPDSRNPYRLHCHSTTPAASSLAGDISGYSPSTFHSSAVMPLNPDYQHPFDGVFYENCQGPCIEHCPREENNGAGTAAKNIEDYDTLHLWVTKVTG